MSELDKNLTLEAFGKPVKKNNKYIILVTTNVYGIDINNLNVKLVI